MEPWGACLGAIASLTGLTELDLADTYASCSPSDMNAALGSLAALRALRLLDLSGTLAAEGLAHFLPGTLVGGIATYLWWCMPFSCCCTAQIKAMMLGNGCKIDRCPAYVRTGAQGAESVRDARQR